MTLLCDLNKVIGLQVNGSRIWLYQIVVADRYHFAISPQKHFIRIGLGSQPAGGSDCGSQIEFTLQGDIHPTGGFTVE